MAWSVAREMQHLELLVSEVDEVPVLEVLVQFGEQGNRHSELGALFVHRLPKGPIGSVKGHAAGGLVAKERYRRDVVHVGVGQEDGLDGDPFAQGEVQDLFRLPARIHKDSFARAGTPKERAVGGQIPGREIQPFDRHG